jgi:hypothetical protein
VKKHILAILLLGVCSGVMLPAQSPSRQEQKSVSPDEIIKAFAAKETEFYDAWIQYTYKQIATIRVLEVDGMQTNERMILSWEVLFRDDGTRELRLTERAGRLRSVGWTADDEEVLTNIQPFALTSKDLPLYDLKYEGKEMVDELNTYLFSVKPKRLDKGRYYFQGRIWVDDQDLQIVRTLGKVVPQKRENQFPEFETLRQVIDDKYWFPVWTHADSVLKFPGQNVRVEETITYESYKRFGSKATIQYAPPPGR